MLIFSMIDILRALILLIFIEGFCYLLFPKHIQGFAVRCLVDAKIANLRLFGAVLVAAGVFLTLFFNGNLTE